MEDQGTLTEILFVRFFMKICERGRSVQSLFHSVLQVTKGAQPQHVKSSSVPIIPTYISLIAMLLEMNP